MAGSEQKIENVTNGGRKRKRKRKRKEEEEGKKDEINGFYSAVFCNFIYKLCARGVTENERILLFMRQMFVFLDIFFWF